MKSVNFVRVVLTRFVAISMPRNTMQELFTKDGFYRSGDLMRQHKSGNYMVEGRKKDLINRGGEKISAEEIENLILGNPKIKNVACVAMPDPVLGEKMCAFVILKENEYLTLGELNKMLLKHENCKIQTS